MGNPRPVCYAAAIALSIAPPAEAQPLPPPTATTGNDMLATCSRKSDDASFYYCLGFIEAVERTAPFVMPKPFCVPSDATMGQLRDIVLQYLAAHPQTRHHSAVSLTLAALRGAFPCPR